MSVSPFFPPDAPISRGRHLRRIAQRMTSEALGAELRIVRYALLFQAAYSAFFFALPLETFVAAPKPYHLMAYLPEWAWALWFAILAGSTLATLISETKGLRRPWSHFTWQAHALTWLFIGASFTFGSPASWTSWLFVILGGGGAEYVLIQPWVLHQRWARRLLGRD